METNPSGYKRAADEYQLYQLLEKHFKNLYEDVKEQVVFAPSCRIDYLAKEIFTETPILIEVKNWFATINDIQQLIKYYIHATERYGKNKFKLLLYTGGIDPTRREILEKIGIEVYLTKDVLQ